MTRWLKLRTSDTDVSLQERPPSYRTTHPVIYNDYNSYSSIGISTESDGRAVERFATAALDGYLKADFDL